MRTKTLSVAALRLKAKHEAISRIKISPPIIRIIERVNIRPSGSSDGTFWIFANASDDVCAAIPAFRKIPIGIKFDVRLDVVFSCDSAVGFSSFQRPFVFCRINLAKIVDATVCRSFISSANEIWNDNNNDKPCEQTNRKRCDYFCDERFFLWATHTIKSTPLRRFCCGLH